MQIQLNLIPSDAVYIYIYSVTSHLDFSRRKENCARITKRGDISNPALHDRSFDNQRIEIQRFPIRRSNQRNTNSITSSCASSICRSTSWMKALFSPANYVTYIDYCSLTLTLRGRRLRRLTRGTCDTPFDRRLDDVSYRRFGFLSGRFSR